MAPGLQNESDLTQTRELWWAAEKKGFKVGTILLRNAIGLPITSSKLNYSASWPDVQVVIENVYEKYVLDKGSDKKLTTFYAYGVSQGAVTLGQYCGRDAERADKILDGVILYATPWDVPN